MRLIPKPLWPTWDQRERKTMTEPAGSEAYTMELTEKAAEVIHEAFEAEKVDQERAFVRVGAHAGGCSGYMYDMDFTEEAQPEDRVFESRGIRILVNETCLTDILGSLQIDYRRGNMVEQGFTFQQLTTGHQCGCGESFTPVKPQKA